jgi:2-phospho-L-lactate/phosphoenolpyruvate guanylyltransferase
MIVAVIPVKRLSEAKSRLSSRLNSEERATLVMTLVRRTVGVLKEVDAIGRIGVATEERELVESLGAVDWLPDLGGLNASLVHAASWATGVDARSMLVVPCDLPLLEPSDIRALLDSSPTEPGLAIAPTQDGGTGALLLSPPQVLPPVFGLDSFKRHQYEAHARNIPVYTVFRPGFSHEIDTLEDLDYLDTHVAEFRCLTPQNLTP